MKNLPHQINQLSRLTEAIRVIAGLIDAGRDLDDDGIVGDALAHGGVYAFKKPNNRPIAELLQLEHSKPRQTQGSRTGARELRRFFGLLGFITKDGTSEWTVSPLGRSLLGLSRESQTLLADEIWRQALLGLHLEGSHPYRILIRLVAARPGLPKLYAGLCLEAENDSDKEFNRVLRIAGRANPRSTMHKLCGANMAANSIKILPSIAIQIRDLQDNEDHLFVSEEVADQLEVDGAATIATSAILNLVRLPFSRRSRLPGGRRSRPKGQGLETRAYDPDLLGARFNGHEDCLDRLSRMFPQRTRQFHASYDLLIEHPAGILLVEAKTIKDDARRQARAALAQLLFYEHFDVAPLYLGLPIRKLILTDQELPRDLQLFLAENEVGAVWISEDSQLGGNEMGLSWLGQMGVEP